MAAPALTNPSSKSALLSPAPPLWPFLFGLSFFCAPLARMYWRLYIIWITLTRSLDTAFALSQGAAKSPRVEIKVRSPLLLDWPITLLMLNCSFGLIFITYTFILYKLPIKSLPARLNYSRTT